MARHLARVTVLCALTAVFASCSPVQTWYKPATSFTTSNTDLTKCQVAAVERVPPNVVTRTAPPLITPGLTRCYRSAGAVYCPGAPYLYAPPRVTQVDLNAQLRGRVVEQCMIENGYTPVALPRCSQAQLARVPRPVAATAMRSETSCVARTNTGAWAIVTPEEPA